MPRSDFARCLEAAQRRLNRANMEFARTEQLVAKKDMPAAFGSAFAFEAEVEKLALLARVLPAYTGHPKALEVLEETMEGTIPVKMGYGELGWFCLRIPALLPKRAADRPLTFKNTYIQQCEDFLPVSHPLTTLIVCWLIGISMTEIGRSVPAVTMTTLSKTWLQTSWRCTCCQTMRRSDALTSTAAQWEIRI